MSLKDSIQSVLERKPVLQEQTARERKIFALLHPATGVGHRIGHGHVGEHVGMPTRSIGTHGAFAPERGFTERRFEDPLHVRSYHEGFDTAQKLYANHDKKQLKALKSEHNKVLFRLDHEREPEESSRYRGFIDGLHKLAGSTPADLGESVPTIEPPKPVIDGVESLPAHLRGNDITSTGHPEDHVNNAKTVMTASPARMYRDIAIHEHNLDRAREAAGNAFDPNTLDHARTQQKLDLMYAELEHRGLSPYITEAYQNEQAYKDEHTRYVKGEKLSSIYALRDSRKALEEQLRGLPIDHSEPDPGQQAEIAGQLAANIELQQRILSMPEPDFRYINPEQQAAFDDAYRVNYQRFYDHAHNASFLRLNRGDPNDPRDAGKNAALEFLADHGSRTLSQRNDVFTSKQWRAAYASYLKSAEGDATDQLRTELGNIQDTINKANGTQNLAIHEQARYYALIEAIKRRASDPIKVPEYTKYDNAPTLMPDAKHDYERGFRSGWVEHRRSSSEALQAAHQDALVARDQILAGRTPNLHALPRAEGRVDALSTALEQRGLAGVAAPHYSDDPTLQGIFERSYRIARAKHANDSQGELDLADTLAKNDTLDGYGAYTLSKEGKAATRDGILAATNELRATAPQFPAELETLPEHAPGGQWHQAFEDEKKNYISQFYRKNLSETGVMLRERKGALQELKRGEAAHHSGVILRERAHIAAVDHVLRNPWVPGSFAPGPVAKLKPAEVVARFGANRYEMESDIQTHKTDYTKQYNKTLRDARKDIGGPHTLKQVRDKAEIRLAFATGRTEQLQAHAHLAALDKRASEIPTFGPKTESLISEQARYDRVRIAVDQAHADNMAALEAKVADAVANTPDGSSPYVDWPMERGTSLEMERLSEDLHRLGFYDSIPVGFEDGPTFLGRYTPFERITTNKINSPEEIKTVGGRIIGIPTKQMNQHAAVLAHEFGHHYAWMNNLKMESFSNTTHPDRANRDEIIAEMVSYNLARLYGHDTGSHAHGYVFKVTGNDPELKLLKDPQVQGAIKFVTGSIMADIERSNEGVTHVDDGGITKPITDFPELTPGFLPRKSNQRVQYIFSPSLTPSGGGSPEKTRERLTNGIISDVKQTGKTVSGINTTYTGLATHQGVSIPVFIKPTQNDLSDIEPNNLAAAAINNALGRLVAMPETAVRDVRLPLESVYAGEDRIKLPTGRYAYQIRFENREGNARSLVSNWMDHASPAGRWPTSNDPDLHDLSRDIALFDAVTANSDRNGGNWLLLAPPGEPKLVVAIDHDMIFRPGSAFPCGPAADHAGEPLPQYQIDKLEMVMSQRQQLDSELEQLGISEQKRVQLFDRVSWLISNMRMPAIGEWSSFMQPAPGPIRIPQSVPTGFSSMMRALGVPATRVTQSQTPQERAMFAILHPGSGEHHGVGHPIGQPVHSLGELRSGVRNALQTGTIEDVQKINWEQRGINVTYTGTLRIHAPNGEESAVKIFIKPLENNRAAPIARNNLGALEVNAAMGHFLTTPEAVTRQVTLPMGPKINPYLRTSVAEALVTPWVEHATPAAETEHNHHPGDLSQDIALFDVVIGNNDRNSGNWLIARSPGEEEHVVAIDHDDVFSTEEWPYMTMYGPSTVHMGKPLQPHHLDALNALKQNADKLRASLAPLGIPAPRLSEMFQRVDWLLEAKIFPTDQDRVTSKPRFINTA